MSAEHDCKDSETKGMTADFGTDFGSSKRQPDLPPPFSWPSLSFHNIDADDGKLAHRNSCGVEVGGSH